MTVFSNNKKKFSSENVVFDLVLSLYRIFVNVCGIISTFIQTTNGSSFSGLNYGLHSKIEVSRS